MKRILWSIVIILCLPLADVQAEDNADRRMVECMYTQALRLVPDSTYASWIAQLNNAGSEAHEIMMEQFGRPCQMQIRSADDACVAEGNPTQNCSGAAIISVLYAVAQAFCRAKNDPTACDTVAMIERRLR